MAELSRVYEFACKWLEKFYDPKDDYIQFVDHRMAEDCRALGFEMDCGLAFNDKYKCAFNDTQLLKQIIGKETDIDLIGSAIYSKWRYFNHWAYTGAEILDPENMEWFIVILERLKSLSEEKPVDDR